MTIEELENKWQVYYSGRGRKSGLKCLKQKQRRVNISYLR